MFLFGLEGSGFIISLALTLLISGAIMFYCLKRFNVLESSIMDQGRVLQSFIVRVQQGGLGGPPPQTVAPQGFATDIALKSARAQTMESNKENDKIEVSDDDDDDEEGNMDEDSSSYVTSDSDNEDRIVYDTGEASLDPQPEEITTVKLDADGLINTDPIPVETLPEVTDSVKIVSIEDMGSNFLNFDPDSASDTSESVNDLTDTLGIEQVSEQPEPNKKQPLSKMRVDHLRGLVVESGHVANMDAAKKLQKKELLKLLE